MWVPVVALLAVLVASACASSPVPTLAGVSMITDEGWSSRSLGERSIELRRAAADGEVVVTLADVDGETAGAAATAIGTTPGLVVLATSESRMSGLTGPNLELENSTATRIELLTTGADTIGIDAGQRMWLSLFDTAEGVLAIAVSTDVDTWDAALLAAEPLLESVTIAR